MTTISLVIEIDAPAERVFDAVVDLRGYGRWLGPSGEYGGTTAISSGPVVVGTTYVEPSRSGTRYGTVTELDTPTRVVFHQPMTMRPRLFGVIDIRAVYTVTAAAGATRLERVVTVDLPWQLKPLAPLVLARFRRESRRTVHALKAFAEA